MLQDNPGGMHFDWIFRAWASWLHLSYPQAVCVPLQKTSFTARTAWMLAPLSKNVCLVAECMAT